MQTISYTKIRNNFTKVMDQVCADHISMVITHENADPVVILSLQEYNSITETLHLLRSPKNAIRLMKALSDLKDQ